jgi:paraquat-inducible protein A
MVSLARVIPETALFAFGALTLMFTVVVTFDARTLWDIADALRERSKTTGARTGRGRKGRAASPGGTGHRPAGPPVPPVPQPLGEPDIHDPSEPLPSGGNPKPSGSSPR